MVLWLLTVFIVVVVNSSISFCDGCVARWLWYLYLSSITYETSQYPRNYRIYLYRYRVWFINCIYFGGSDFPRVPCSQQVSIALSCCQSAVYIPSSLSPVPASGVLLIKPWFCRSQWRLVGGWVLTDFCSPGHRTCGLSKANSFPSFLISLVSMQHRM
jgi:hypothetical protein